jgi:hypothetical protein
MQFADSKEAAHCARVNARVKKELQQQPALSFGILMLTMHLSPTRGVHQADSSLAKDIVLLFNYSTNFLCSRVHMPSSPSQMIFPFGACA